MSPQTSEEGVERRGREEKKRREGRVESEGGDRWRKG